MPIHRGIVAASITELPTLSIGSVTNYNQDRATFNAIVSANYQSTTVKFQYNTTNNFASYTEVTATNSPVTGQAVAVYYNITGLSVGTTYYVRAVISNNIGIVTSSVTSFTTWTLKTFSRFVAGSENVTIQTVTPTGGSTVVPSIYNLFMWGAGGGGSGGGGGGGGYIYPNSSVAFNNASSTVISVVVGSGGAGGNIGSSNGVAGGDSSISGSSFTTLTATGGAGGAYTPQGNGGASGSGTNTSKAGGAGNVTSTGSGKSITYYYSGGGGGGALSAGDPGNYNGAGYGGDGGVGGADPNGINGNGGSGGGGFGATANGQGNRVYLNGNTGVYGCGGATSSAGSAGSCTFKYYGP
jgi:hypothetical protein